MNTTLKISFWRITSYYLILVLLSAWIGIPGTVWLVTDSWWMLLSPLGWFFSASFIITVWSAFLWLRGVLTPDWIEIGKDGIRYHTLFSWRKTFVAWQDIDNFYVRTVRGKGRTGYFLFYILKQDPKPSPKYFWRREKKIEIPLAEMVRGGMRAVIQAICNHCPLKRLTFLMSPYDYL
ncbi:hypothetical protein OP500_03205 [Kingella sp. SNUBH-2017]|uniref:DUF304 domain-containing protein n=1 Tax=Kingella pumchi TaxID=2779506 RepID=A0ABS9NMT5_9NEIS|nr:MULTISPECIES: hypothetical protein [Kingella]MCG6504103.1 hypothetical protein [Kingella pumchi]MDD2182330.1 hypothetical protein [Kingella sp. SNUBH-2017]